MKRSYHFGFVLLGVLLSASSQSLSAQRHVASCHYPQPGYGRHSSDEPLRWLAGIPYYECGYLAKPNIVSANEEGRWQPAAGYTWVRPSKKGDLTVEWQPGQRPESWPHVGAGSKEGSWLIDPGYRWAHLDENGGIRDLAVRWQPGLPHSSSPHVVADENEGYWLAEPGYIWAHLDNLGRPIPGDFTVRWQAGQRPEAWPHIAAGEAESSWSLDPGYDWVNVQNGTLLSFAVRWQPGLSHSSAAHVLAGKREGTWSAEPGYTWVHPDDKGGPIAGDLAVQWQPGQRLEEWSHVFAATTEGAWKTDRGFKFAHSGKDGLTDFAVVPRSRTEMVELTCQEALEPPIDIQKAIHLCNVSVRRYPRRWQGYFNRAFLSGHLLARFEDASKDLDQASRLLSLALSSPDSEADATAALEDIRAERDRLEVDRTLESLWIRYLQDLEKEGSAVWHNWEGDPWSLYKKNHHTSALSPSSRVTSRSASAPSPRLSTPSPQAHTN